MDEEELDANDKKWADRHPDLDALLRIYVEHTEPKSCKPARFYDDVKYRDSNETCFPTGIRRNKANSVRNTHIRSKKRSGGNWTVPPFDQVLYEKFVQTDQINRLYEKANGLPHLSIPTPENMARRRSPIPPTSSRVDLEFDNEDGQPDPESLSNLLARAMRVSTPPRSNQKRTSFAPTHGEKKMASDLYVTNLDRVQLQEGSKTPLPGMIVSVNNSNRMSDDGKKKKRALSIFLHVESMKDVPFVRVILKMFTVFMYIFSHTHIIVYHLFAD